MVTKLGKITLSVNGEIRQQGDISDMTWSVAEVILRLSSFFERCLGDVIFTGTTVGVGPLDCGDIVEGEVGNLANLNITIV